MGQAQRTLPSPRHEEEWAVKRALRMLDAFEDVPGFAPLRNILLRYSRETAASILQVLRGNPTMPRECYELNTFETLLLHMTPEEKASHVALLVHVFKALMTRHRRIQQFGNATHIPNLCRCNGQTTVWASNFAKLYVEVLQVVDEEGTSGELVRFVEYLRRTLAVEWNTFLLCGIMDPMDPNAMNPNAVDYILACFSNERFNARGIRETHFLMYQLLKDEERLSAVLIRHGFKYSFDLDYYELYCRALVRERVFKEQPINIDDAFTDSVILRMQMAVDILVSLRFEGERERKRKLLRMLWRTLPDPLITPDELYHLMEPFSVPGPVLVDLCARYRELFPGVPLEKQPRSLQHLARVQIRESMVRAHSLGERAVRSLGLPKKLEDYLWKLEEF